MKYLIKCISLYFLTFLQKYIALWVALFAPTNYCCIILIIYNNIRKILLSKVVQIEE